MSRKPRLSLIIGIVLTFLCLTACSPRPTPTPRDLPPFLSPDALGTPTRGPILLPTPTEDSLIRVVDALGREIVFETPPQRIVIPGEGAWIAAHTLYLFPEVAEKLIAMEGQQGRTSDFLPLIDPTFEDKPHLEQGATPEQVAALNPDVIIVDSGLTEELGDPLEELGLRVVYIDLETAEGYFQAVAAMGGVLGDGARATEIESFYRERTDRVVQRVADVPDAPRVLVIRNRIVGEALTVEVPGVTSTQTMLVKIAGGIPVWTGLAEDESWTRVNYEQIVAWDPQIILVVAFETDPESLVEALEEDPQWGALRAVQGGNLFGFPVEIYGWDSPDPRWILGLNWVVERIHPDLFPEVDNVHEMITFYEQMYRMDQAAIEEHIFSVLEGDF